MYPKARETFQEQVARLRANYGEQHLPDAKCALFWEELKEFSPKQIRNICDHIIRENQFAPTLSHFIAKSELLREKIREWERQEERRSSDEFWRKNAALPKMKSIDDGV